MSCSFVIWGSCSMHAVNRLLKFSHTFIRSMSASTRSWSTSFCAWITLLLLHIFPDISFSMKTQPRARHVDSISIQTKKEQQLFGQTQTSQRGTCLCFHLCTLFYPLVGAVQRLCDIKGHTAQFWKCHKHHTLLHTATADEKMIGQGFLLSALKPHCVPAYKRSRWLCK